MGELGLKNMGVYGKGVTEIRGKDLLEFNFHQIRSIAKIIKSMFGPMGFSKIITRDSSEFSVTQKGVVVAKALKTRIPIVQMLVDLAETQETNCGDGTKTVIMLAEFLWEKARRLLAQGMRRQVINQGFSLATDKALRILDENAITLENEPQQIFRHLLASTMTGRFTLNAKHYFVDMMLKLFSGNQYVLFRSNDIDFYDISFRKAHGKSMTESELVNGVIIYKEKPNPSMPRRIENPRVLLVQKSLDFFIADNTLLRKEVAISDPAKLKEFSRFGQDYYEGLAESLNKTGVNVILCQKRINARFADFCANLGIIALELVGEQEIRRLSKVLNVGIVSTVKDVSEGDIGKADLAEFREISKEEMFFITKKDSKIFTFLLRGGTVHVLDELEEVLKSSLRVAIQTTKDEKVLPGAGALECEISLRLKQYANTFPDKVQIVISEFGKALENVPGYIVMNSGGDPLDVIPRLRGIHMRGSAHDGFDCDSNSIVDVVEKGILDGFYAKRHALVIASEMIRQLVRVDDLIMAHNGKLHDRIEEGRRDKQMKRNEDIRRYFKKNEDKLFAP